MQRWVKGLIVATLTGVAFGAFEAVLDPQHFNVLEGENWQKLLATMLAAGAGGGKLYLMQAPKPPLGPEK